MTFQIKRAEAIARAKRRREAAKNRQRDIAWLESVTVSPLAVWDIAQFEQDCEQVRATFRRERVSLPPDIGAFARWRARRGIRRLGNSARRRRLMELWQQELNA